MSDSKPRVEGNLDSVVNGVLSGWAWDPRRPDRAVELELLANGRLVACFTADRPRADLRQAGKRDGNCAFFFELPPELLDGVERELRIQVRDDGTPIPNGSRIWRAANEGFNGYIEAVQGSALVGWARQTESEDPVSVRLFDGPRAVADAVADEQRQDAVGSHGFRIPLPPELLDGRPHTFVLREAQSEALITTAAFVTPRISTPWSAIQRFAGRSLREYLAPQAAFRYQSLARQMERLAALPEATASARLKDLGTAHEILKAGFDSDHPDFGPIAFQTVENPQVSVVIPVHDQFPVTRNCLASLLLAPNETSFEVILVDDGSSDPTREIEQWCQGLRVVRNERTEGFVGACNRGAAEARGDWVVLLNNDTEVTAGWLDELIWPFQHFDGVGLTGSMLLFPDGRLQEAGGIVWKGGDPANYGRAGNPNDPRYHYCRQVDYLSGASIMLPRSLWERLGGFDPAYAPAYFEDTDLAFRVREAGLKTVYTPFSKVFHYEGQSNGTDTGSGIKRYQEVNRPRFKARWAAACLDHGEPGKDPERNKDRHVDYRVLVVDAETPRPDRNAGSYAAIQEMRLLQSLGFKITFVPDDMAYMGSYTDQLQRMGVECIYEPYLLSIGDLLSKRGREFDLVYITRYYVAEKLIELVRRFAPQARILFNNADLHFLRELRMALNSGDPERLQRVEEIREAELKVMREVDLVLSYNEVEHAIIQSHNLGRSRIATCPWVVEPVAEVAPFDQRRDIAFLGGYRHLPNVEAVRYFVEQVMPLLRQRLPGVRFLIYGSDAEEAFADLPESEDVAVAGWVEDVGQVYDRCRVFVAPLLSGAGIKGKVLAALAHGVPSVLSPVAVEGFQGMNGEVALIADQAGEWAEAIVTLYQDEEAWWRMSRTAREYIAAHYGFEQGRELMRSALSRLDLYPADHSRALVTRE